MKTLNVKDIKSQGDIRNRQKLLFDRLHADIYRPDYVFIADKNGWPGDWEGRTILALTSLAQILKEEALYLDEIIRVLKTKLNEKAYLGHILDEGIADEQQLSGHSWLLRGLCEYYRYREDECVLSVIKGIVKNLFLPLADTYLTYPILPEQRVYEGAEAGNVAGLVGKWHISTDTGCAFIPLDGLSDAYELLSCHDKELAGQVEKLLSVMIEKFMEIPFALISVQTHATLSALRGILRFNNMKYMDFVIKTYDLYLSEGMSANYANYNWFGRPEWTEPCAIIDSFMIACQLYIKTQKDRYAKYAQLILYNALYRSQRDNGGFGTDTCVSNGDTFIASSTYEAYWCCTMRGGEGLLAVSKYSILENDDFIMLYPVSGVFKAKAITFEVITSYPDESQVEIRVIENNDSKSITLKLITDKGYNKIQIGKDKEVIAFNIDLPLHIEKAEGKFTSENKFMIMKGPVILGTKKESTGNLSPIHNAYLKSKSEIEDEKTYILFSN